MVNRLRLQYPRKLVCATMNQANSDSPRRAVRRRNKPQKYGDFVELSPTKQRIEVDPDSSEDEQFEDQRHQKPTALFSNDDVEGQDMFKFKTRHTKLDLQNIVKSAISSSPKVNSPLKTPRKSFHRGSFASPMNKAEATPKHVRDNLKKKIIKAVDSDSAESDFSDGSSDDFVPDEDENESENESDSSLASPSENSESEQEEETKKPLAKKTQLVKNKDSRKPKDSEYIVTPDDYFMMHSSKKIQTSDHTLARLKNMNLNENTDEEYITEEHRTKIAELNQSYEQLFDKWLYVLSENFNIILYGIGSKRSVLQQFQAEKLTDMPCIVVNGYFPSLTMKSILETIIVDLLDNTNVPSNISDVVNLIDSQLTDSGIELFLIIHNIDGPMLRNAKAQATLASISQIKNVHTIATIDHINAPLLWDHSKLNKFKFTWWDVTTFLPYRVETSFENSLLSARGGALQLSSLRSVFQSLTSNAKGIFRIIIQYQLENQKLPHYQGISFKDLYSKAREQFLVSSELGLRAQLTEFLDHQLLRARRDGDYLSIPIDSSLLNLFLEQEQ